MNPRSLRELGTTQQKLLRRLLLAPQGSSAAMSGSAVTSACATLGEHTPSRRWGALSRPNLAFSVACMSTSLTMPICSAARAARKVSTAAGRGCARVMAKA